MKIKGGDKFEAVLKQMAEKLAQPVTLEVGFLEGSTYPDGTPVPLVAAVQEFGAPSRNIPPRPFFRNMIAEKSPEWPDAIAGLLKATDYDVKKTLSKTGEAIKGQLQQSIVDTNSPPLAPATIAAKGGAISATTLKKLKKAGIDTTVLGPAKPLVDTGHMLNSVDYKIDDGLPE